MISQCRQSKSYGQGNQADLSGQVRVVTVFEWSGGQVGQDTQGGQGSQSGHLKALSSPFLTLSNAQTPFPQFQFSGIKFADLAQMEMGVC